MKTETAIAKDLGISRTPVRDALRKLEADGLVNSYPNRFIEVATFDEKEAVHLVTEHLAEFYKIGEYFPFIVKEPIVE